VALALDAAMLQRLFAVFLVLTGLRMLRRERPRAAESAPEAA
jgi:uncharacterized membrane protein YfcA